MDSREMQSPWTATTMKTIKHGIPSYYSTEQVQSYLRTVGFPNIADGPFNTDLPNLELLVRLHLLAFPFENSQLHYSKSHIIDVRPEVAYERLVRNRQGGLWCHGQNGLFLGMLRGLGFRAYAAPARVNKGFSSSALPTEYFGLTHVVIFVQFDDPTLASSSPKGSVQTTYVVDVGFGGNGLVRPILLKVGQSIPGSAPPEEHRLIRASHPESSFQEDESSRNWALQYRCGSHQPDWITLFLFYEDEYYPDDCVASSQWLSQYPVELFRTSVVAIRHFVAEDDEQGKRSLLGRLIMIGTRVYKRVGDRSELLKEFHTEQERVQILKEDFGITVDDHEVSNIFDTAAAL